MPDDPGTPQGATPAVGTTESTATPQATGSDPTVEPANNQPAPAGEAATTEAKRLQQLEMERNMWKNKVEAFEQEKEEARKAELSETERLKEELAQERQGKAQLEAKRLREELIAEYPDERVREAASRLVKQNETNLTWGDVDSVEDAKADLFRQMDALKEVVSPDNAPGPQVHPNNPSAEAPTPVDRNVLIDNAAKNRDFTELLRQIPSVAAQVETFKE